MHVSYTLSMWVAAGSVLNGQIDCQNMSWLHCFESCDHFQDPTRSGDADVVCVTSTMSAVEDTRRWRGATFLFHQLGKMMLQATSISYTVATGQKFMVWCWNARMVIRHIDYIYIYLLFYKGDQKYNRISLCIFKIGGHSWNVWFWGILLDTS